MNVRVWVCKQCRGLIAHAGAWEPDETRWYPAPCQCPFGCGAPPLVSSFREITDSFCRLMSVDPPEQPPAKGGAR